MAFEDLQLRTDIREFMRVCEHLIGLARQNNNGALSTDECEAILYYINDLKSEVLPYCKTHHDPSTPCPICSR